MESVEPIELATHTTRLTSQVGDSNVPVGRVSFEVISEVCAWFWCWPVLLKGDMRQSKGYA